jgi:hypothetical protein
LAGVRRRMPTIGCGFGAPGGRALPFFRDQVCIGVILAIRREFIFVQASRLLFLAEFLKSRIGAQGVPVWMEPEKGRGNARCDVGRM